LSSAEFADLARIHPEAFTRQRALLLPHRVSMRLKLRKGSIGDELDRFFGVLHPRLWHGLRLLAIDGSTARLPNTDDARATFGAPPEGSSVPLARFSRLYDVLNGLVIERPIESRQVGERVLAGEHRDPGQ